MISMFKKDFTKCPMYHKSHTNGTKLTALEDDVASLANQMNTLILEQKVTMDSHIVMKENVQSMKDGLESHMEDEAEHHANTSNSINALVTTVTELVTDQQAHRKEREKKEKEREETHKKWKEVQFKVITSIITVVTLAVGTFMWKAMVAYEDNRRMQVMTANHMGITNEQINNMPIAKDYK